MNTSYGSSFERIFVALLSIVNGAILVYLAIMGPLILSVIQYKTPGFINNQIVAQDFVNLVLLGPVSVAGGVLLLARKPLSRFLLIMTPLYLIYFVLSYTIGWEWSSQAYQGNSQNFTFCFLFILVSSLIILMYCLLIFPRNVECRFRRKGLAIYSVVFTLLLLVFASMWIGEVREVMITGTTRGYNSAPTAFWLIRIFDLGFTIPLGLISVYLLWTRPATTFHVQFLFYGFFLTMVIAVNAMGIMMFLKNDPTFLMRDLAVFLSLAVVIVLGFLYIIRNYRAV